MELFYITNKHPSEGSQTWHVDDLAPSGAGPLPDTLMIIKLDIFSSTFFWISTILFLVDHNSRNLAVFRVLSRVT